MKATLFLVAAGLVAAQDFTGQPECALKCLEEYVPKAGCDLEDTACQCDPAFQEKLTPQISPCLMKECEAADLPKALAAAQAACEAFSSAAGKSGTVTPTATVSATVTGSEAETETETETASDEEDNTETVTASVDTSITGSVTLPAIFSTTTDVPVTPGPNNRTTTRGTGTSGDEETGTGSGSETSETGAAGETGNAAAMTGPAMGGFLAILAAFFAL
ncbi:CFEM domain-containing protein [Fusarium sp. LHS14.1]|nr:CFEM domain-containing protein [Fusarium sp. LHS14.1]